MPCSVYILFAVKPNKALTMVYEDVLQLMQNVSNSGCKERSEKLLVPSCNAVVFAAPFPLT